MIGRLLANFLGAPDILHDLVEQEADGHTYRFSESENGYFIPRHTLDAVTSRAAVGKLESLLMRRLARLKEWDDQHPDALFARTCPLSGEMMHLIRYPAVSGLHFMRGSRGIWITAKQLETIRLHDPSMPGALSTKPKAEAGPAADAGDKDEDEEGNEVESGVGGFPAEKGDEGEVTKVWIIPGCIVCDLCENTTPDVFKVTETTSTIQMTSRENWTSLSTSIIESAVGCPVDVIKYELKE